MRRGAAAAARWARIGLIGSSAKWTRFAAAAGRRRATAPTAIDRITSPIGLPGDHRQGPGRRSRSRSRRTCCSGSNGIRPRIEPATAASGDLGDDLPRDRRRHPGDPFTGDPAAALAEDGALLVRDGVDRRPGPFGGAARRAPRTSRSLDLDGGLLLPGFVDTHVHFPQIRAIGGLGMPLLDWLERCALPEECRLADRRLRPRGGRGSSSTAWWHRARPPRWCSARTSPPAVDELFTAAGGGRPEHHRRPGASATGSCARTC